MKSPLFSVIIPTLGRRAQLASCLEALSGMSFPKDAFEVIVVDDNDEEATAEVVQGFESSLNIRFKRQAHSGPAAARNTGAAMARGKYLAFTDDDCRTDPGWLASLAAGFAGSPGYGLGGRIVNDVSASACSTASMTLADFLYAYFNRDPGDARLFFSNNLAVPARTFQEIGGFSRTFPFAGGEDREFCFRWRQRGHRLAYVPEALVRHGHRLDLISFLRQHFTYGRGAFYFHRAARSNGAPFRIEPPSFYLGLILSAFRGRPRDGKAHSQRPAAMTCLLTLSQLANASGLLRELCLPASSEQDHA